MSTGRALVVGGGGTVGAGVVQHFRDEGLEVLTTSRRGEADGHDLALDPATLEADRRLLLHDLPVLDAVVFAQGTNENDALGRLDLDRYRGLVDANLTLVVETLDALVTGGRLARPAKVVVLSSVWEAVARPGKFSYTLSKAALGGLVRAAALDLAPSEVLVNGVLPGVIDTPMTRGVLSPEQLHAVEGATGFGRLVDLAAVVSTVTFLCSPSNTGVTGQSIAVDLGFSVARSL